MSLIKEWIYRLRHNRGFGVQSPAAFHIVTHVLREGRHPYYLYPEINALARTMGESPRHCRRLFRLVNAIKPRNILILDSKCSAAACAIAAASNRVPCTMVSDAPSQAAKQFIQQHTSCQIKQEDISSSHDTLGLLYVGTTPHYAQAVEKAMKHCDRNTVIIVEGIKSRERRKWWRELVASGSTVVTMDFHRWGALFFDREYRKQHYTFWFK
jgi:hypothetical protein